MHPEGQLKPKCISVLRADTCFNGIILAGYISCKWDICTDKTASWYSAAGMAINLSTGSIIAGAPVLPLGAHLLLPVHNHAMRITWPDKTAWKM